MFIPLNIKTHYSIREALCTAKTLKPVPKFAFADYGIVSGAVQIKNNSPGSVIGTELIVKDKGSVLIYSKNLTGWKELIKIVSEANSPKNYDKLSHRPTLRQLSYSDNLIFVYLYEEMNPVDGSYYGINSNSNNYINMRNMARVKNKPTVCAHDIRFVKKEDSDDFAVLLSIANNTSVNVTKNTLPHFFNNVYYIPNEAELSGLGYTEQEISNTEVLYNSCEKYSLNTTPKLPKAFKDGRNPDEHLYKICTSRPLTQQYLDRLNAELAVIKEFGLADYFLIILDIIKYVENKYHLTGIRGSGAGSMICHLSGICKVDPIPYDLIFERFINAGRMTKDRIQLPDIDIDVPAESREDVIEYIKEKYGRENVGQILTYQRIKTAAAVKAVFRTNSRVSFEEVNKITKLLPEEAKITDKLKEMDDPSVLIYAIEHDPDAFREWVYIDDKGEFQGEYAHLFNQIRRIEGLNSARSKHAAGIIITPGPLSDTCPLIYDSKTDNTICGMEMGCLESIGALKADILGLRFFDKMLLIKESK